MKCNSLIFFITLIIALSSCSESKSKTDFLDFRIGMEESEFLNVRDTLVENGILYKYRRDYYYDFKISDDLIIPSEISWGIKNNELREIHLTLGRKGMNNRRITEGYFTECIEQYHSDIVYNIFHKKYGTPDELNSEGRYPCWKKSDGVDIRFSRGYKNDYTCDTSRYVMGAFIYWSFDSIIEMERDFRIMDNNVKSINEDI